MYKKLLLVVLSVITLQTVKAQTEKGSQQLGATVAFSTSTSNNQTYLSYNNTYSGNVKSKATSYSIFPSYSYFIADRLDVAVGLGYGYTRITNEPNNNNANSNNKNYIGTISLRKYFLFDNKIGIRTGPYLTYQKTKNSYAYSSNSSISNSDNYGGGLGADFVYFPAKNIGLAAGLANLNYTHSKNKGDSVGSSDNFNLSFVNNLQLSIYYVFGK
ncbi:hypothetical protein G7092_20465 [Mucilaginibacter sp. HC2]|uniref:hypothetical protein n=1 Tax=Mucilaginibacter inviolabilis TaxID=2714892 RepID=UPI0014092E86|nr:hypothetical protein [Mucilaginibacter inviolabilis]NHA06194.1 hypothetical protein [Mucilaginibacter inviolabilis]